ncbi:sodium/hydrogen exchanger [Micromonospora sp. ATCC 39149]|uniref:cation:proton antiporter n=1 Tax=Micromonospora sp. (strain ATCC 39149 / NRRL 15099 / SCC 1413) TaxID=219305 RepID=UPI0001A50089|nr:cation:proton antiporter [Micromonospora sp. ATCC 39149]EEP73316.1 sodium/hydrogen exchanger [Micromonospora sp. ATCC 39149]QLK01203.2 cation:proton antiporter [Micromonospora carbonacea]
MIVAAPVPPLGSHQLLLFLLQVGLLLLLAVVLGRVAQRFGLPAVVGELLTGVLLGPSVLGALAPDIGRWLLPADPDQVHLLDAIGQFGVVLLVAVAGLHLDLRLVRRRAGTIGAVAVGGLAVPLGLGIAAGLLAPAALLAAGQERTVFALFVGVAMAVSAVPVIAKTLTDMRLLHRDVGQIILAAASLEDAAAWFLLSLISSVAVSTLTAGQVVTALLYLVAYLAVAVLVGRPVTRRAMRWANAQPDGGAASAVAVVIVLAFAAGAHALGLEAIFGALVAGVLIGLPGNGEPARLAPLRTVVLSVLAPIFLASAGLRVDLRALADPEVLAAGAVILALAVLGKYTGAYLGARLARQSHWEGVALGAGLNARGAVEIIIAMVGLRLGVLNTASYTIVVLVAVVTSVMAPPMLRVAMRRVEQNAEETLRESRHLEWAATPAVDQRPG